MKVNIVYKVFKALFEFNEFCENIAGWFADGCRLQDIKLSGNRKSGATSGDRGKVLTSVTSWVRTE